jgi:hypothetical protein
MRSPLATSGDTHSPLLSAMMNLSSFHRDHERFYGSAPREGAITLQRHPRTLQALADTWSTAEPSTRDVLSPCEGAVDMNSSVTTQLDGVLFMDGEGRSVETTRLVRDLRTVAEDQRVTGDWLAKAMESSWGVAAVLVDIDGLADMLGEHHRERLAGRRDELVMGRLLDRAADVIEPGCAASALPV